MMDIMAGTFILIGPPDRQGLKSYQKYSILGRLKYLDLGPDQNFCILRIND